MVIVRSPPARVIRVRVLPGTLCCVLGQDTLLSQCLSPPRCVNRYRRTYNYCWWVTLRWTIPWGRVAILPVASCYRNLNKFLPGGALGSYEDFVCQNLSLFFCFFTEQWIKSQLAVLRWSQTVRCVMFVFFTLRYTVFDKIKLFAVLWFPSCLTFLKPVPLNIQTSLIRAKLWQAHTTVFNKIQTNTSLSLVKLPQSCFH